MVLGRAEAEETPDCYIKDVIENQNQAETAGQV